MRSVLALSLVGLVASSFGHPPSQPNVVGTWVVDPASAPKGEKPASIQLVFQKDGTATAYATTMTATGIYKVTAKTVTLTILKRNGRPIINKEGSVGVFTIVDNGKALLGDSGVRLKGKVVMMRLIRKKK